MNDPVKPRESKTAALWRAMRFLYPYRKLVAISLVCAFFMGGIMTTGMSAILPILKVLVEGKTVAGWMNTTVASHGGNVPFYLRAARWASQFIPDRPVYAIAVIFGFVALIFIFFILL